LPDTHRGSKQAKCLVVEDEVEVVVERCVVGDRHARRVVGQAVGGNADGGQQADRVVVAVHGAGEHAADEGWRDRAAALERHGGFCNVFCLIRFRHEFRVNCRCIYIWRILHEIGSLSHWRCDFGRGRMHRVIKLP
jgi:hypothetical protein